MPATADQYKALILAQAAGDDPGDSQYLASLIGGVWLMTEGYAGAPGLRFLYALRQAIDLLMARERKEDVDTRREGDRSVTLSDRFEHLQTMRANTDAGIREMEAILISAQRAGGASGLITRVTPIARPGVTQDISDRLDRMIRGDAFLSPGWFGTDGWWLCR